MHGHHAQSDHCYRALLDHRAVEVSMICGRLFKHSAVTCGSEAVEAARGITHDLFLLGEPGVHPTEYWSTGDAEEAARKTCPRLACGRGTFMSLPVAERIGEASRYRVLGPRRRGGHHHRRDRPRCAGWSTPCRCEPDRIVRSAGGGQLGGYRL